MVLNLIFILLLLLPSLFLPLVLLLLPFISFSKNLKHSPHYFYLLLLPISFLSQLFGGEINLVELLRVIEIVIFLMFVGCYTINGCVSTKSISLVLLILIIFGIGDIFKFQEILYIKQLIWGSELEYTFNYGALDEVGLREFRLGSIYYNPNLFSQSLICISMFLTFHRGHKYFIMLFIFIGVALFLTGSRTGMFIYLLLILDFLFNGNKIRYGRFSLRNIVLFLLPIILLIIYLITGFDLDFKSIRVFDIEEVVSGSGGEKLAATLRYIDALADMNFSWKTWLILFGNGKLDLIRFHIDNEIGYCFYAFGIYGLLTIFFRVLSLIKFAYRYDCHWTSFIWFSSVGFTQIFSFRFLLILFILYSCITVKK